MEIWSNCGFLLENLTKWGCKQEMKDFRAKNRKIEDDDPSSPRLRRAGCDGDGLNFGGQPYGSQHDLEAHVKMSLPMMIENPNLWFIDA